MKTIGKMDICGWAWSGADHWRRPNSAGQRRRYEIKSRCRLGRYAGEPRLECIYELVIIDAHVHSVEHSQDIRSERV